MKKYILLLIAAALLLCGSALADNCAAILDGQLYVSMNGLLRVNENSTELLDDREILCLHSTEDALYYVASFPDEDSYYTMETLVRMDKDGNRQVLGEPRPYDEYGSVQVSPGYHNMTIYKDHIYFMADNGRSGSYTYQQNNGWYDENDHFHEEIIDHKNEYTVCSSLYRMDLDGSNLTELIPDLGTSHCYFDIAGDRIAVAAGWRSNDSCYYSFYDFRFYNMKGKLIKEFSNPAKERDWIYKKDCEFNELVIGVTTDGKKFYASLADSEGDFFSSRLTDISGSKDTLLYEADFTPSLLSADCLLVLTSYAKHEMDYEELDRGLFLQRRVDEERQNLAFIPRDLTNNNENIITRLDNMVYLSVGNTMLRVPLAGGTVERLEENGFVAAPELDPENIPDHYFASDSDTRLYTKDELEYCNPEILGFMRNEILARHGYVFKKAKYRDYFGSQSWYKENPSFSFDDLNEIEAANVETIKAIEANQ